MTLSQSTILSNRQKVADTAVNMLAARIGVIEGSRILTSLSHSVGAEHFDPDFLPFVGIDSETDHLPIGEVRQHWAADALARKDVEITEAEDFYRKRAYEACSRLVVRFADQV